MADGDGLCSIRRGFGGSSVAAMMARRSSNNANNSPKNNDDCNIGMLPNISSSGGGGRVLAGLMNLRGSNERKNNFESKDPPPSPMSYPRPTKRRRRRSSTDMTKQQLNELVSLCVFLKRQPPERVNLLQAAMTPFKVFCHSHNSLGASRSVLFQLAQLAAVICHIAGPDRKSKALAV